MSLVVRKPASCICENKDADQLRSNCASDQRLCFRSTDSTISLLPKSEISILKLSSVAVQPGLCGTWSETPKTGFLTTRLKCLRAEIKPFIINLSSPTKSMIEQEPLKTLKTYESDTSIFDILQATHTPKLIIFQQYIMDLYHCEIELLLKI